MRQAVVPFLFCSAGHPGHKGGHRSESALLSPLFLGCLGRRQAEEYRAPGRVQLEKRDFATKVWGLWRRPTHTGAPSNYEFLKVNSSGDWIGWVFRDCRFSDGQKLEITQRRTMCKLVFQISFLEMGKLKNKKVQKSFNESKGTQWEKASMNVSLQRGLFCKQILAPMWLSFYLDPQSHC